MAQTDLATTDIYDAGFVAGLFDEMSKTYGITNYVSSFGFCERWRKACVSLADITPGMVVHDLMTGMGECWGLIGDRLGGDGEIVALDLSDEMCRRANERVPEFAPLNVRVVQDDFLNNGLEDSSADCVISAFGLKTFSSEQLAVAAKQIERILKPGGNFSLLEISVPSSAVLRAPYMLYLKHCIPTLGRVFLGNPDNYRMLGVYTERFGDCDLMERHMRATGLEVERKDLFFGCASALVGHKPVCDGSGLSERG